MKFKTHNTAEIDTNMTCLTGYIQARRSDLVKVFGSPQDEDGSKVTTYWAIQFDNGTVATIYDWKREAAPGENETYSWHIGGRGAGSVGAVHEAFREGLGLGAPSLKAA